MSALQTVLAGLRTAGRILAQLLAGGVIVLALLVGLARLLLPEADRFRDDIRTLVATETGLQIDFDLIGAGISVHGPELRLSGVVLQWPDGAEIARFDGIAASVNLSALIFRGKLLPGRILIRGTDVDLQIAADGEWRVQGRRWRDYLRSDQSRLQDLPEALLQLDGVGFSFQDLQHQGPRITGLIRRFEGRLANERVRITADITPDSRISRSLSLQGELPLALFDPGTELAGDEEWDLQLAARGLRLNRWLEIARQRDLPVLDSSGNADVSIDFRGAQPGRIVADLDLAAVTLGRPDREPLVIDSFEAALKWRRTADGWTAEGAGVQVERDSRRWPESTFAVDYAAESGSASRSISAVASFLRAEDVVPVLQLLAPDVLARAGFSGAASGDLSKLDIKVEQAGEKIQSFSAKSTFAGFGYVSAEQGIDITGLSGRLDADDGGGSLELSTRDARVGVDRLFGAPLEVSTLQGLAIWRAGKQGYRLLADDIRVVTPDGNGNAALELTLDSELKNPAIDLRADVSVDTVAAVPRYLPKVIPAKVLDWLNAGLSGAGPAEATFALEGALSEFPYDHGEGVFRVDVKFANARLDYAPGWPALQDASGELVFDGVSMVSTKNTLAIAGAQFQDADVRMPDLRTGLLEIKGAAQVPLDGLLQFLQQSPVGTALGPVFNDVRVAGNGDATLDLRLPVRNLSDWRLRGQLVTSGATAGLAGLEPRFTDLAGRATIRNTRVSAKELTATLLGKPVTLSIDPVDDAQSSFSHRAFVQGRLPIDAIQAALGLPALAPFAGDVAVDAQALFPGGGGPPTPFSLSLRSDLTGLGSDLPDPLFKLPETADGLNLQLQFPERGTIDVSGSLQRGIAWALQLNQQNNNWKLQRGTVVRGIDVPTLPERAGIGVYGAVDSLDLAAWARAFDAAPAPAGVRAAERDTNAWYRLFREARLQVGEFYALGHRFVDVDIDVQFEDTTWDVEINGPWIEGSLSVPYNFAGSEPLEFDMDRLLLIETQAAESETAVASADRDEELDPRGLPPLDGKVRDFVLGNLRLGTLDIDMERVENGLESRQLRTVASSFRTDMTYDWLVVDNARRSRLHIELRSLDFRDTLVKLGYSPLIEAESGAITADLLWEGGPGMEVIEASTGSLDLTIRKGVVRDVETGTGRILGLLSITRLPSRLALDFKDMVNIGLPFDRITGSFRIDFGNAWTCNLGLEGPVADMGIVGRTGIVAQDYEQVAAIRPHVSNLAPVAGAFLAGPAVGITTLLVTQIFKKPLSSVGENYYTILGTFEDPVFTRVNRDELDTTSFADCAAELPSLSPEEIKAIEELIAAPPAAPPDAAATAAEPLVGE